MATVRSATRAYGVRLTDERHVTLDWEVCLTAVATVLVVGGFFLPWVRGAGIFSLRSFSGFALAGIARDLGQEYAAVPLPGLVILLVPAAVLNASVLATLGGLVGLTALHRAFISIAAGIYGSAVTGGILFLVLIPVSGVQAVAGGPQAGLFFVFGGSLALLLSGLNLLRLR
jgi:hypothetical protein